MSNKIQNGIQRLLTPHASLHIDATTGIYNLVGFETAVQKAMRKKSSKEYMMIVFDLDKYNDLIHRYGYVMGDKLLRAVAVATPFYMDKVIVARLERDKFVLYMECDTELLDETVLALEKIISELHFEQFVGDIHLRMGGYKIPREQMQGDIHTLIDFASTAHCVAMRSQQEHLVWYDERIRQMVEQEHYYHEHALGAIEREEFKLYLQPQVNMSDTEHVCAEALVRWALPNGRIAYPESFVAHLEDSGVIAHLDFYMLRQVCAFLKHHIEKGYRPFRISVNLSHVTLSIPDFAERFLQIVEESTVPHRYIGIEVHEASIVALEERDLQKLVVLKKSGVIIAVDAFASGYASLRLLPTLPIDTIKLDRKYLRAYDADTRVRHIIASIIDLAHVLELQVICEGIEHQRDITLLQELGCDCIQGYYLLRPVSCEEYIQNMDASARTFKQKIKG
ncbi:MAG: bifunctional diguanylate cyclase/phosphodiesterase [Lachnospiraceae bacterium]